MLWVAGCAAGDGAENDERFLAGLNFGGERVVLGGVGEIGFTGEVAQEGAALAGDVVADGAFEGGIAGVQSVEDGAKRDRAMGGLDLDQDFCGADAGQIAQVPGQLDSDGGHGRVWTSTERTPGRSWTMAFQLSPPSVEA